MRKKVIDWTAITQLVEVRTEAVTCFRIVPDRTVKNYSNYKFFKDIYELEKPNNFREILQSFGRLAINTVRFQPTKGFKVVYRVPDNYIWYEIVMRAESINFYVLCSQRHTNFVRLKLEQCFPSAPIEEVDESETTIPEENTIIADLKLQRHNFFSLHTDYGQPNQPIEDLLMTAEDLKGNDVLKFSLRAQPYDQNYWSYKTEEWHDKTLKGKAPKRLRVTKEGLMGATFGASDLAFQKLGELFRNIHEIAFKRYKTQQIVIEHSTQETREVGDISRQTSYKMTAPVFRVNMKVASHSDDDVKRLLNLKSLSNSLIDLKDTNNSVVRTKVYMKPEKTEKKNKPTIVDQILRRKPKEKKPIESLGDKIWKWAYAEVSNHKITPLSYADVDFNVLCDKELGKIQQLPTVETQKKFEGRMDRLEKKEVEIPEVFRDASGIFVGYANVKGEIIPIYIPDKNDDELHLPLFASGIQGSGKDTFGINWIYENAMRGRGTVVLDVVNEFERGMADTLTKVLPKDKYIDLNFAHKDYTPYLDWAEGIGSLDENDRFSQGKFASELTRFFEAEDEAGVQTERYLRSAAKALPAGAIIKMGMLFLSEKLRNQVIEDCKKRGDIPSAMFWEMYNGETEHQQKALARPILNRLDKLIGDPTLKPIFGATPNGAIDFDKWLSEGKVIICRLPKHAFNTTGIRTLVHWITVKVWLTKQKQFSENRMVSSFLVLNEPHQYFTKGLATSLEEILPESRKYKLGLVLLFHNFAQVPDSVADILIDSGANFIFLKQKQSKSFKRFANRIEESFSIEEDCMKMDNHEAFIGILSKKKDQPVIRVKMNDMPDKRGCETYDNTGYSEECLKLYCRPIAEVNAEVLEDEKLLLESFKKSNTSKK